MNSSSQGLVSQILSLPIFHAEWVLWFLIALSVLSVALMIERGYFYWRRRLPITMTRQAFERALKKGDLETAMKAMDARDTLETNVVIFGLRAYKEGPEAVEELLAGATAKEKERYDRGLSVLATIASNAPFVGLFGTVLGIIRAFLDLSQNVEAGSSAVMAGIAEALVATAIGLVVAIPAVVAYNAFKGRVAKSMNNTQLLSRVLLAHLKGATAAEVQGGE